MDGAGKMAVGLFVLCFAALGAGFAVAAEEPQKAVGAGNNAFAVDLYARLRAEKGNLFFSPYSISSALAMTYAGARGDTATQMAKVLHFDLAAAQLHAAFGSLTSDLNAAGKANDFELRVANTLWVQEGYKLLPEFLDLTKAAYGALPHDVDFAKATEAARQTINRWVEEQTKDKIKNLIPPGMLAAAARLVLTNAIYFKGRWASEFTKDQTMDMPFTLASGEKVTVPTMHQAERFGYRKGDGLEVLEMPYKGQALSMFIFLPAKADGLAEFEKSLTADRLSQWLSGVQPTGLIVALPKFRVTSAFLLADSLNAMGMKDAFALPPADFSGMTGQKDLFIGAVIHKAFVDVNETGTEAAAATAVIMEGGAAPAPKPFFRADHPFLFLIRDNRSGAILFMGRVLNPKE